MLAPKAVGVLVNTVENPKFVFEYSKSRIRVTAEVFGENFGILRLKIAFEFRNDTTSLCFGINETNFGSCKDD